MEQWAVIALLFLAILGAIAIRRTTRQLSGPERGPKQDANRSSNTSPALSEAPGSNLPHEPASLFHWGSGFLTADAEADRLFREHVHALCILLTLSRADGAYRTTEKSAVRWFLVDCEASNWAATLLSESLRDLPAGGDQDWRTSMLVIEDKPRRYKRDLSRAARRILAAGGSIHPEEARLFTQLQAACEKAPPEQ